MVLMSRSKGEGHAPDMVSGQWEARGGGGGSYMVKEGQTVKSRLVIVRVVGCPTDDVGLLMVVGFQHLVLILNGPV